MSWDGKMYDKYRITHTDGTPLKGKKYFVLRLDSDDPVEAARVAAAMRAYKGEPRNCDKYNDEALASQAFMEAMPYNCYTWSCADLIHWMLSSCKEGGAAHLPRRRAPQRAAARGRGKYEEQGQFSDRGGSARRISPLLRRMEKHGSKLRALCGLPMCTLVARLLRRVAIYGGRECR